MRKFFGFALCAGMAGILAVIWTLLHLDWKPAEGEEGRMPPAAQAAEPAAAAEVLPGK